MMKLIIFLITIMLSSSLMANSVTDRTNKALDNSAPQQVKVVFAHMVESYNDKDASKFLSYVDEDEFLQDYITFDNVIRQDFRIYTTFDIHYWFNQSVPDSQNRIYLFVHWQKSYETLKTPKMQVKKGDSRFLFELVDGKYKLVGLAGDELFGDSEDEWNYEVPKSMDIK